MASDNISIIGIFSCKEVCWEDWTATGSENSWGNTLLMLMMENVMTQWIQDNTRFKGEEVPSRLDLVFTKEPDIIEDLKLNSPTEKSDHALVEFKLCRSSPEIRNEDHKAGMFDYRKGN